MQVRLTRWDWPFRVWASRDQPMRFEAWLLWRHDTTITNPPPPQSSDDMLTEFKAALQ